MRGRAVLLERVHACVSGSVSFAEESCCSRFSRSPPSQNCMKRKSLERVSTVSMYATMFGWESSCSTSASCRALCRSFSFSERSSIRFITHGLPVSRTTHRYTEP